MDIVLATFYVIVEVICIALVLLAMVQIGFARLNSSIGVAHDGLPVNTLAPAWSLPDLGGHLRVTPADDHWQLLLFADQSLASFPSVVAGLHDLAFHSPDLEILVLSRAQHDLCEAMVRALGIQVPVVPVDQIFYDRFRVRVMPFATILDPSGRVRWVSLVNTQEQLVHTWALIRAKASGEAVQEAGQ